MPLSSSSPSLSTTTTMTSSSSSVSFASLDDEYDVLHIADYSKEEIAACWFTPKEKELIKVERRNTLTILNISGGINTSTDTSPILDSNNSDSIICTRGIAGQRRKKRVRNAVFEAVMDEQDFQFARGICDADKIAQVYSLAQASQQPQALARSIGRADEEWVLANNNNNNMTTAAAPQDLSSVKKTVPSFHEQIKTHCRTGIIPVYNNNATTITNRHHFACRAA